MKNVTLAIDDTLLDKARDLAGRRGTTLNAMVRAFLADEIEQEGRIAAAKIGFKRLMDESAGTMGADYSWDRNDIYAEREDRLLSRLEHPSLRSSGEKG